MNSSKTRTKEYEIEIDNRLYRVEYKLDATFEQTGKNFELIERNAELINRNFNLIKKNTETIKSHSQAIRDLTKRVSLLEDKVEVLIKEMSELKEIIHLQSLLLKEHTNKLDTIISLLT